MTRRKPVCVYVRDDHEEHVTIMVTSDSKRKLQRTVQATIAAVASTEDACIHPRTTNAGRRNAKPPADRERT